jgi:hypothetical protein
VQAHAERIDAAAEVAQRLVELFLARDALGHVELAADLRAASKRCTSWPRSASDGRRRRARGPGADHGDALARGAGVSQSSVSWQARGFTRHEASLFWKTWSRHAWLQAMQVLMSLRALRGLVHELGSASSGRAIETMSARPRRGCARPPRAC